jgi:uncharacterized membrane protein
MALRQNARRILFYTTVWLKGLDGALELLGSVLLLTVPASLIIGGVRLLTQDEIVEDPRDLVANYLRNLARHVVFTSNHFIAAYLFIHGVIKIALVWALLRRELWAYPPAMFVFAGLIVYQMYRFSLTCGWGLLALSGVDVVMVILVFLEYRALRSSRGGAVDRPRG